MNCILSSSIFAVVGTVPYHPPGLEAWVLGVGAGINIPVSCRIVNISVFLSTKVLLAIIKDIAKIFLAPTGAQEVLI